MHCTLIYPIDKVLPLLSPSQNCHRKQEKRQQERNRELCVVPLPILHKQRPLDEPVLSTTANAFDTNLFTQEMKHPVAYQQDEEILHVS